ncbi:MAG: uncharacterized protein KVP18_002254 [Porospora cf. gigantea A]|uniref:uncharacterized protein n=2 Tax=Porospora cf. gigantea A TaxID=2853593 RepID=UPI00355A1D8C|nr:MAG: hypothetical protein KVP18_002254 [Porospora cf. gigantea A]
MLAVWVFFIVLWLGSVVSPLAAVWCFLQGYHSVGISLVAILVSLYLWRPEPSPPLSNWVFETITDSCTEASITVAEGALDPEKPTLYAIMPHGVYCCGWSRLFAWEGMRHVHFCFSPLLFYSPLFTPLVSLVGRTHSSSRKDFEDIMSQGKSVGLIPGGFEEATIFSNGSDRLYIKKRKGFLKLALTYGYRVVPVFNFGERFTFWNVQGAWRLRLWLNKFNIPGVLPAGRWFLPILPVLDMSHLVFGDPIDLTQYREPLDVDGAHELYVSEVERLYKAHALKFYGKVSALELW